MDNDGIIVLVQQNIENPAVFFGVVADELAVHLLHDSVDSVALDFLFLHTFQDILHVAGRNGDMDHFEFCCKGLCLFASTDERRSMMVLMPMFLSSLREHGFSLSISAERYNMPQCTFFWVG